MPPCARCSMIALEAACHQLNSLFLQGGLHALAPLLDQAFKDRIQLVQFAPMSIIREGLPSSQTGSLWVTLIPRLPAVSCTQEASNMVTSSQRTTKDCFPQQGAVDLEDALPFKASSLVPRTWVMWKCWSLEGAVSMEWWRWKLDFGFQQTEQLMGSELVEAGNIDKFGWEGRQTNTVSELIEYILPRQDCLLREKILVIGTKGGYAGEKMTNRPGSLKSWKGTWQSTVNHLIHIYTPHGT